MKLEQKDWNDYCQKLDNWEIVAHKESYPSVDSYSYYLKIVHSIFPTLSIYSYEKIVNMVEDYIFTIGHPSTPILRKYRLGKEGIIDGVKADTNKLGLFFTENQ